MKKTIVTGVCESSLTVDTASVGTIGDNNCSRIALIDVKLLSQCVVGGFFKTWIHSNKKATLTQTPSEPQSATTETFGSHSSM